MKRAVIFLNGNKPSRDLVFETIKTTDTIICADGGAKWAIAAGITPQVIVGDLDSLPKQLYKKLQKLPIDWVTFSSEKDYTDSELALKYAIEHGFMEIVVIGVFGNRMDHLMANMTHFSSVLKATQNLAISIVEKDQSMYFVKDKLVLVGEKGKTVSILSLDGDAKGVSTKGLKWRLDNETLRFGESRGVSNEIVARRVSVEVKRGVILLIHQKHRVE